MPSAKPSLRECFWFPVSSPQARRDVLVGGTVLLTLLPGWILNLGHRLEVVRRVFHDEPPYFRGFMPWWQTFVRGLRACAAIAVYLTPAAGLGAAGWTTRSTHPAAACVLGLSGLVTFVIGLYVLPGGMTWNAAFDDITYLYRPDKAFHRALRGGAAYLRAWLIALAAITASLLGLLAFGIGFFYTSVWAWSVVGYAFSKALVLADPEARAPREGLREHRAAP